MRKLRPVVTIEVRQWILDFDVELLYLGRKFGYKISRNYIIGIIRRLGGQFRC